MTAQKQSALQTIEEKKSLIVGIADKSGNRRAFSSGIQIRGNLL